VHFASLLEYGYEQDDRGRCSGHATPMSCQIGFADLPLSIGVWLVIRAPTLNLRQLLIFVGEVVRNKLNLIRMLMT